MVRLDVMVRPADSKADNDHGWYVTLSGIIGDAVGGARGDMPLWGSGSMTPLPNQPGQPGTNPGLGGAATTPGTGTTVPGQLVTPPK